MSDTTFRPLKLSERTQGRWSTSAYRDPETRGLVPGPPFLPLDPPIDYGGAGAYTTAVGLQQGAFRTPIRRRQAPKQGERRRNVSPSDERSAAYPTAEIPRQKGTRCRTHPEYAPGMRFDHGLAGIINLDDTGYQKRKKGSLRWGGAVNSVWVSYSLAQENACRMSKDADMEP